MRLLIIRQKAFYDEEAAWVRKEQGVGGLPLDLLGHGAVDGQGSWAAPGQWTMEEDSDQELSLEEKSLPCWCWGC